MVWYMNLKGKGNIVLYFEMNGNKIIMCLISPVIKSYSINAKTEKQQNLALLRPNFSQIL